MMALKELGRHSWMKVLKVHQSLGLRMMKMVGMVLVRRMMKMAGKVLELRMMKMGLMVHHMRMMAWMELERRSCWMEERHSLVKELLELRS